MADVSKIKQYIYENLEIILVDDGSPDRSGVICDELAEKDSRIRVIHKANGGLSDARNAGIEAATGAYIAFVDSDDWCDPNMIELLHSLSQKHDAEIAECSYRSIWNDCIRAETRCSGAEIWAASRQPLSPKIWTLVRLSCKKRS